jgi:type IV pilus assembly protein PilM
MAREKLCVGIDIGASSVKLCQLKKKKGSFQLAAFGQVPLASETVVDGALMNSARVVEAIQELVRSHRIKNKQVALSVSGHAVIIKKIPLPQMTREELEQSIQWEAEQFIPFDMADVYLDVQIVREASTQQGQMDVVLVAAKKDFVNEYTSVIIEAGLEPAVLDVDSFAVETMYQQNYDLDPNATVVLVNCGAAKTNINILARGVSSFTRDLTLGGNNFTEEIQRQLSITQEEAETMKLGGKSSGENTQVDALVPAEVERAMQSTAESLTTEIQRSVDFYAATTADPPPSKIYLTGGTARVRALQSAIEARVRVPVEVANPFRRIDTTGYDPSTLANAGPAASVAVGLALRFPGDC